jgi:hypothetical protein
MKNYLILILTAIILMSNNSGKHGPIISLDKEIHNFNTLEYGEKAECFFRIKNTGNDVLIIKSIKSSCGCAIINHPIDTIQPGESSKFSIKYDTKRPGAINKHIIF